MSATVTAARPAAIGTESRTKSHVVRAGLVVAAAAAALNGVVAAVALRAGVSLELATQRASVPLPGFVQLTFVSALIGIGIAAVLRRRSDRPVAVFHRIAVALTAASLIFPAVAGADMATKVVLVVTHLLAAAIVIPVVARRLSR